MPEGAFIPGVCVGVATVQDVETGEETQAVGLGIPKKNPVDDDPQNADNYDDFYISLDAALLLLEDLTEAIAAINTGKKFA